MPPLSHTPLPPAAKDIDDVLHFWFVETKPFQWYRRDAAFDGLCRRRFGELHQRAARGRLNAWRARAGGALALIILLDQFSRNLFRDTPDAFACDAMALDIAEGAIRRRFDFRFGAKERAFFYMPFMHSEDLSVQERSVALFKARLPGSMNVPYAVEHHAIVKRFSRFPHRNKVLGRVSTPEEIAFLKGGGFNP